MDLEKYKKNPKTQYLAKNLERLLKEEADILMLGKEEGMKELAEKDLENIEIQKKELVLQMDEILEEEINKMKEEDEFHFVNFFFQYFIHLQYQFFFLNLNIFQIFFSQFFHPFFFSEH